MKTYFYSLFAILILSVGVIGQVVGASQNQNVSATNFADLVLVNGKVITVDAEDTIVEAIAAKNGTIMKVGTDSEINPLIGPETKVLDLDGKTATPGLIDAHGHINIGYFLVGNFSLDLRPGVVESIAEIADLVGEKARSTPNGEWIRGAGWLSMYLKERRWPTKEDLDPISPDHPVLLTDLTGWYAVANSYALRVSNITAATPNPPGGVIDKDPETGEPTGILLNHAAIWMVKTPQPTNEQREEGIKHAVETCLSEGITTVHDNWILDQNVSKEFIGLENRGELPIRVSMYRLITSEMQAEIATNSSKPYKGTMVTFEGWKIQVDGTSVSAYTYEPHNGKVNMLTFPLEELKRVVSILHASGFQLSIHVIGDKAFDVTLDAIEAALNENPKLDHRIRIEHAMVSPGSASLERAKELGVVLSFQPTFIYNGGDLASYMFGPERAAHLIPIKTALDIGIPVGLGSDYPTTIDTSPIRTMWDAVSRKTYNGSIVGAEESITIKEALRLHTMGSAYLAHQEGSRGSIEEGKLADIVIWSRDFYSIPVDQLLEMRAETTIVGGKIVYQAEPVIPEFSSAMVLILFLMMTCALVLGLRMLPSSSQAS